MGRVSKHKRIKACDPFYKGPRRVDPRVDNLPPEAPDDQPVPKTLSRLLKAGKHLSQSDKRRKKKESASDNVDPERGHLEGVKEGEVTSSKKKLVGKRSLKGEVDSVSVIDEENDRKPLFKRQKGESLKAYLERIDIESNARIMEAYRKSRGKSERRKRYYEKRRWRLKGLKGDQDLNDASQSIEFDDLKDRVSFGEVVQEPPRLKAKPRGSSKVAGKNKDHSLLLLDKLGPRSEVKSTSAQRTPGKIGGLKRQRDIEVEREKAIEQYRLIKKARTKGGTSR